MCYWVILNGVLLEMTICILDEFEGSFTVGLGDFVEGRKLHCGFG